MKFTKREQILHKQIKKHQKSIKGTNRYAYLNTKKYGYCVINKYFIGKNVLELGSDGTATSSILVRWSKKLTVVDMIDKFSSQLNQDSKLQNATFIVTKWEEYKPSKKFSDIFLTDSLEHVQDSVALLKLIKSWLQKDGRLHIIVPNALSLHRLLGVEMGYIKSPYELNDNDILSEHVKVYDTNVLKTEIKEAGLKLFACEGVQLKINTDFQLANFDDSFSDATFRLSNLLNENCAEIYACCTK